jgi:3-dehydroshikimate dehydratase
MRKGIATVSVSGLLTEKLDAIAAAGFDGVEIFDNDLIACPSSPREIAARCADLGLGVDLFQPFRDVEGVPPERFEAVLHRVRRRLEVAVELGAGTVLACSNTGSDAVADPDLTAEQLHRVGSLAAEHGVSLAFEALAWGRHIARVGQAWQAVVAADHPNVTLAVDTFHLLARGDGPDALAGVPGDRIGFLQVADAPLLDMNVLEWSRHFRCFPGQGTLDVDGVVLAVLEAGYDGPLSLEVFSDLVREEPPGETARDGMRSLVFLEDQVARRLGEHDKTAPATDVVTVAPPAPESVCTAFLEVPASAEVTALLHGLGFAPYRAHRSKPVTWWRNGGANVVVNDAGSEAAIGLVAPPVNGVAARAEALLWPEVARTRGAGEAMLPGITSPSGLHVFVSAAAGDPDDWQRDFPGPDGSADQGALHRLDHVGVAVQPEHLDQEVGFFRTLFGLAPGPVEEFIEPHGRLRSRALRPRRGDLRLVLNAVAASVVPAPRGVTQVAFACSDLVAEVRRLREAGVELLRVPDNYYADLEARFALPADVLGELRENGVLYDRVGDGELLHAYTPVLAAGFYVELLERRGGYDGYGAANTPVRLAAQQARTR